jgi:Tfp pilus assembly protein PilF
MFVLHFKFKVAIIPKLLLAMCVTVVLVPCAQAQTSRRTSAISSTSARSTRAAQFVSEGIAAFERGDLNAARTLLQQAVEANPQAATAHTFLGAIADQTGDLAAAERHFARAATLTPRSASARNNYGAVLLRLNRECEATAEFEAALRADAKQPNALINLAQIYFARGDAASLGAANDLFMRAYSLAPDAEIARALTIIALRRNDRNAAAEHYRDYSMRVESANNRNVNAATHAELGGALLEAGLLAEAEKELSLAVKLDPSNVDSIVRLARVYFARKEIFSAGRTLEAAIAHGVDSAPVYALFAEVYEQSGHPENAIPAMRLAIQRDPQSEKYRFAYGILLTNSLAPAAAVIRLEEALKIFPDSARFWFVLGMARFKESKSDEAARAFTRAIELDAQFAPAYAYLGMTRVELGQSAEGVELYEKSLKADPKLAVVHYLIADALLKETDADNTRIESNLKRAIEKDATFTPAHLALGKLYSRTERFTEAARELELVTAADPELAEAYYQLGRVYSRLKRTPEAHAALAKFKTLSDKQKQQEQDERRDIVRRLSSVLF